MRTFIPLAVLLAALNACSTQSPRQTPAINATERTKTAPGPVQPYLRNRPRISPQVMASFERANSAMAEEHWTVAIAELQLLTESAPRLSGPRLNLALAYQGQGNPQQAEQYYRQALQVNPSNLAAYNQYAIFLRQRGRFPEAEKIYLEALQVWEAHAETHRNIGVLYDMYMGDRQRALTHFYRYQALNDANDGAVAGWIADLNRQLMTLAQGQSR